jgi:hypothetical protein
MSDTPPLIRVYAGIKELAPSQPQMEDGFAVFSVEGDFNATVAERAGVSANSLPRYLSQLKDLGVYRPQAGGRGKPFRRYLKLDADELVATAAGSSGGDPPPRRLEPPPPGPPQPLGVVPKEGQVKQFLAQLETRMDAYKEEIEQLKNREAQLFGQLTAEQEAHAATRDELAQVKAELEQAQASVGPTFVVSEGLAKHLGWEPEETG